MRKIKEYIFKNSFKVFIKKMQNTTQELIENTQKSPIGGP